MTPAEVIGDAAASVVGTVVEVAVSVVPQAAGLLALWLGFRWVRQWFRDSTGPFDAGRAADWERRNMEDGL